MPTSRRSRSRPSRSLASRIARSLAGEPEERRKRLWPDTLAAAILLPLGIVSAIGGLVYRSALGPAFRQFEIASFIVVAAGVAALRLSVCHALVILFPRFHQGDERDYPTLMCGFPFLALAIACILLMMGLPWDEPTADIEHSVVGRAYMVTICIGQVVGMFAALLVPLGMSIARALRRRRDSGGSDQE
jgi:predicted acyltransferase